MSTAEQEASSMKSTLEHLATKYEFTELKTDIAQLDVKLEKSVSDLKSVLTWWMFGMGVGLMVAFASVIAAAQTIID